MADDHPLDTALAVRAHAHPGRRRSAHQPKVTPSAGAVGDMDGRTYRGGSEPTGSGLLPRLHALARLPRVAAARHARALRLWLTHGGGLDPRAPRPRRPLDPPPAETALRYTYRPSDPTPAAGGPSFNPLNAGTWTQRAVEQREDVLCFTGEPFAAPLALGGAAVLRVRLWSASRSVDVVARLCRVDLRGASFNLCEGLTRVDAEATELSIGTTASSAASSSAASSAAAAPDAAGRLVSVTMSPLAVELSPGERLRLHVCSAAHPRWMRNLCADPDVPLHEQRPPSECFACVVRIGVDEAECCLELPVVDDDGA